MQIFGASFVSGIACGLGQELSTYGPKIVVANQ
jgi:hypothetical protein